MNIKSYLKIFLSSLLLCFCLLTHSMAAHQSNNIWRSMPFIEIMAAMMKAMNNVLSGHNNSINAFNSLPYSPIFTPSMEMFPGANNFNTLPMSPSNFITDTFKTDQNQANKSFLNSDKNSPQPASTNNNNTINGIWQSLSGDVLAIYNNNRFIWSDGQVRNLVGYLMIKGNKMIAYIPAKQATLYFQFYKEPGKFIVRDTNAKTYTFKRLH